MSLSSAVNRVSATGNGAVDTYSYTFRIVDDDHIKVIIRDTDNIETILTKTTHYTVSGVGDAGGGSVALVNGSFAWLDGDGDLKSDYVIVMLRQVPNLQETDIRNQGSFFPETHENALDYLTMITQQLEDQLDRAIRLPESISGDSFDVELPADVADAASVGKAIVVNSSFNGFELAESNEVANPSAQGSFAITDGQSATALSGVTLDGATYSSGVYMYEIKRGTTVFSTGDFSLHYRDSTWYLVMGLERREDSAPVHGVTLSIEQSSTVAQVKAAADSGAGNGTIKIRKYLFS